MGSLLNNLEIGKRALDAQRLGITVTGHNLANLNTPNFARQQAEFDVGTHGMPLAGVDITEVRQIRDRLLDERVRRHTQNFTGADAQSNRLREMEALFSDLSGEGITDSMAAFWDAWQDLTTSPESEAARITAIGRGETLASQFRRLHSEVQQLHQDIDSEVRGKVNQINQILESVASLNRSISVIEADSGQNANEQRDTREAQLAELSKLINFRAVEGENGSVKVLVGGIALVDHTEVTTLEMRKTNSDDAVGGAPITEISVLGGTGLKITGGELAGLIEVRDTHLPEVTQRMDELASVLMQTVNALHKQGYGLDGSTGLDFFVGDGVANISVNAQLQADAKKLAVAATPDAEGDNQVALAIAQLRYEKLFGEGTQTAEEFNSSTVGLVGLQLQRAQRQAENDALVVQQLTNLQQSISGVSIDEELAKMIQFQRAYEAAARYVTTVDDLLETLVNM